MSRSRPPRSRPPFPAGFRRPIVDLVRFGRSPDHLAREFEPSAQSIRNWVVQADRDDGRRDDGMTTAEREELRRLRRENRCLREAREILAKHRPGLPGRRDRRGLPVHEGAGGGAGLAGISRRMGPRTHASRPGGNASAGPGQPPISRPEAPDRLWLADITYAPTGRGFLYLTIVLGAFSRRIVGWSMVSNLRLDLVLGALGMALSQRRPRGIVPRSDRGSQCACVAFSQRCREAGVVPSMGKAGDCFDNAMAESFFASLECELIDRTPFRVQCRPPVAPLPPDDTGVRRRTAPLSLSPQPHVEWDIFGCH